MAEKDKKENMVIDFSKKAISLNQWMDTQAGLLCLLCLLFLFVCLFFFLLLLFV
jgi:hypothetical protein